MKTWVLVAAVLAALASSAGVVQAHERHHGWHPRPSVAPWGHQQHAPPPPPVRVVPAPGQTVVWCEPWQGVLARDAWGNLVCVR